MARSGRSRLYRWLIAVVIVAGGGTVLLSRCGLDGTPPAPTEEMLPELDGYRIVEEEALLEHITGLADGAALLAGQPELAVAIAAADEVIGCYVDVGAVQARVYSDLSMPLSAGVVAIADRNALLDPANLFACVGPLAPDPTAGLPEFELCKASYTLTKDDNEFYIIYAGTTAEICQAFCAQLEGCEAQ